MRNLVIKIKTALQEIEKEKGPFIIKCLIARNPDDVQWDLVLSATWFEIDQIKRLDYLTKKIMHDFDTDCISQFSGIITIDPTSELGTLLSKVQDNFNKGNYQLGLDDLFIATTENKQAKMVIPLTEYRSSCTTA